MGFCAGEMISSQSDVPYRRNIYIYEKCSEDFLSGNHAKHHHKHTGVKPFTCRICKM
jgi:hypothetical protein